jgi:hypothetical protein
LGQRPGVKVGHRRFEHDKARKPLREGAFVLLPSFERAQPIRFPLRALDCLRR